MHAVFLIADITHFDKLALTVQRRGRFLTQAWSAPSNRHLDVLLCLDKFLRQVKIKLEDLRGLILLEGGGSFSGVRQAAAVLNTICVIKGIPILGLDKRKRGGDPGKIMAIAQKYFGQSKKHYFIRPIYNGEPNITCPTI